MKKVFLFLTMFLFAFTGVTRANVQQNRADQVIEQGFEDGMGDWTMNHCHSSSGPTSSYGGNTGNYAFRFYYTANYPQYLISPELDDNDGVNFTFYAARYSSNYPETFKVGYSSTTNEPTEFTWGSEVTCTTLYGVGAYQEYSYDFPAGTKYVSIACTSPDQFYLFVDDITVTATEPAPAPTPGGIVEVTIGDPTSTTVNSNIPGYTLYDYAISQQIYTADEIGVAGTIETLTMWLKNNSSYARNINVYMTEVEATEFASTTDWVSMSADDMVASFTIENAYNAPIEFAIPLSTPFEYSGTGNLVICFQDVTGSWSSGLGGVDMDAAGNQAIYAYRDGTVYDPSNVGVSGYLLLKKNVIKLSIMTGGGEPKAFATVPEVLDLGYRPNGAWMAPYVFNMKSNVGAVTVNALDFSGNYFTYNAELPATVSGNKPLEVAVTTGTAEAGEVNSTITVLYSGNNRDAEQLDIKATAYDPAEGDVYEQAIDVTSFPYNGTAPAVIYKNYELPEATEGADAVYKMTFANDVMLTAGTTGADGVAALYTEDFAGEGGPMADNNYVYNGPTVNPGPTNLWFSYSYTGSNTWYGTSAGGGFYFGYKIPAAYVAELGLAGTSITTVEAAARESYPYECYILKGGANPFAGQLVGYGEIENPTAMYFFDINLENPVLIGEGEDIWVVFYSDSPYAAYCGRYPVDTENGKIWTYNPNATSPAWAGNTNYTPVIYTRFIELPTGREVTVDLASMTIKEGNGVASEIAAVEGSAMNVAKAQIANNNSRDVVGNNIEDMFVPAGTYYLAVASTDDEFPVSIATAEVPAPEQAIVYAPMYGETNVEYPYIAEWILGDYTTEMQVLLGTQYPPQTALIDWTTELVAGVVLPELEPNQSYFMQVNERNVAGTTYGEIIAFTTPIDPVEGLEIAESNLYPGDAAVLTWTANARTLKGYNVYVDGVKYNESLITTNAYNVEGLEYNMAGYDIQVSAVYDAGESELSEAVTAYMTGYGSVSGHAYDKPDEESDAMPIAFATVMFSGSDEYGVNQTFVVETDEEGAFAGEILAGTYTASVITEGYDSNIAVNALVIYNNLTDNIDIYTHEFYYPVGMVTATEEGDEVLVEWSWNPAELMIDFETGDFSQAEFTLPAQYPWAITTTNPYEGTYCMKSTCEGVASGISAIEVTVDVPYDGLMGFWVKVSSEQNYDKFHFYIDGVEMGSGLSGQAEYAYKEYAVTEGTHTYKFEYAKDSSVNSNDDCIYVDNVTLYKQAGPAPSGMTYNFDDGTFQGWTTIDANNDGYDWVLGSQIGGVYLAAGASLAGSGHNSSADLVCSGSFSNATGAAITPDNYLVSPTKISAQDGAAINFWACAQDASYAAEHFGVAVSTGSNTAAADFTMLQEWTMTAKNAPAEDKAGRVRGGEAKDQGSWYEYTVDLSAYAGQEIWVAIRHFNCNDQFILNVDDITLGDGSEAKAPRNDREVQSFNVYRRNNVDAASVADPELIVEGTTEFAYTDAAWATLEFGEWQWGIAATYEGYAPTDRNRDVYTYTFDSGLEGWTNIDADGDGNVWYNSANSVTISGYDYSSLGHNGAGCFMVSQSYTDLTYDAFDANNYLVSPQKYQIDANSSITFWQDYANDSYPDYYEVMVSTAANPGANDFTSVWSVGSKGKGNGAKMRNINSRYENWTEYTVSLAAYAGQEVWIAFHHEDYDNYEVWIDDVTITAGSSTPVPPTPGPTGSGISEIIWSNVIDKDMEATLTFNVSLNNGQSADGAVVTLVGENNEYAATVADGTAEIVVRKGDNYAIAVELEGYASYAATEFVEEDEYEYNVVLQEVIAPVAGLYVSPTGWAMWEGTGVTPTPPTPPTPGEGEWYYYDNGINEDAIGTGGGNFWWAVMFPAGSYEGNAVTKVATYDYRTMTGNVTIYNDGTTAPATAVGTADVTLTGSEDFVEVEFAEPVTIDPSKNLWIVYYNGSGADYPAAVCANTGDANGRWVSLDGTTWEDMAIYSLDYTFMIRAYVATANKGEVVEISAPQGTGSNGTLANAGVTKRGDRAPLSYKVMLDGEYVGETEYPFYQIPVEGMEEGSEHTTGVAALYATGMGDWVYTTWTYAPCSNYAGTTDFTSAVDNNTVTLNWTLPGAPVPPGPGGNTFSDDFENGLNWNVLTINADGGSWIHSDDNLGGYDYTEHAHSGTGFAMCYSFVDYVGAFDTDSYMYTTEKYSIVNGSTLHFWADNANDSYPENFSVVIATADNPSTAADFTTVWSGGAKGTGNGGASVRHNNTRYDNWRSHSVDLSAYAGQTVYIGFHDVNYDAYEIWIDDVELTAPAKGDNRDMWDLVGSFTGTSAGQQAVATDGNYIYTASWQSSPTGGHTFYQYTMDGTFVEGFEIAGATGIRDLTTDGEYFYGTSGGAQIFILDFTTRTLVGTINCSGLTSRHISYDPERDGFWSGNWSTLALYSRTGALIQNGPAPTSAYGSAYYKDSDNVEHLFLFCQPNSDCKVYDYNITTGTLGSNVVLDYTSTAPGCTGIAGGCFIGEYNGNTCWYGNSQQDPNLIAIYELEAGTPGPGPQPGNILGVMIWRDGEPITMAPVSGSSFVDAGVENGEHEYCVRVVYSDYAMACEECATVEVSGVTCDPVTNLTAHYYYDDTYGAGILLAWEGNANSYKVYVNGQELGATPNESVFIYDLEVGNYTFGIVAVYGDCESDMVTVDHAWTLVDEDMIVNAIYPNPTSGDLHIIATAMTQISIYNAMGQMVYSQDVNADEMVIDMSQYEAGVYMVNIITKNGSTVKRITVVK